MKENTIVRHAEQVAKWLTHKGEWNQIQANAFLRMVNINPPGMEKLVARGWRKLQNAKKGIREEKKVG